jgi:hypothetical protein
LQANAFITFDDGKKNKQNFGLLGLSKDARIDGLEICRPEAYKPPDPQYFGQLSVNMRQLKKGTTEGDFS